MNLITALAVVIGALGALATWLFLGPLAALGLQIWAAFIAWASFFHCGGGVEGFRNAAVAAIWGSLMATLALVLMPVVGMETAGAAICVGLTVALMILGAHMPLLSAIPAAVYGYASTAAFALLKTDAVATSTVITTSPFLNISVSMLIGALFGYVSQQIAKVLTK